MRRPGAYYTRRAEARIVFPPIAILDLAFAILEDKAAPPVLLLAAFRAARWGEPDELMSLVTAASAGQFPMMNTGAGT